MTARRHRIVVDLTFDIPITERLARRALQLVLDDADKEKSLGLYPAEIIKGECKEGSRVLRAEFVKGAASVAGSTAGKTTAIPEYDDMATTTLRRQDGGPAFPGGDGPYTGHPGISKREYFAAQALVGMLNSKALAHLRPETQATVAYTYADAMLDAGTKAETR